MKKCLNVLYSMIYRCLGDRLACCSSAGMVLKTVQRDVTLYIFVYNIHSKITLFDCAYIKHEIA